MLIYIYIYTAELKNISFNEFRPEEEECSDSGPKEN